jgi:hypothetical protein
LVEPDEIAMIKDERHGKVGRIIWRPESAWAPVDLE